MENKIEIKVPEGKEAIVKKTSESSTTIEFVDKPKGKMLNDYIIECGFTSSYFNTHTMTITRDIPLGIDELTPYQAMQVLDAIARDLNGDWVQYKGKDHERIVYRTHGDVYQVHVGSHDYYCNAQFSRGQAKKAIEICGTEFLDIIYRRFEK